MFRIEKKPGTGHKPYTHNIYFKEKLMSEYGYFNNGVFKYDDPTEIDLEEFFPLKIAELPKWFIVKPNRHFIHKEFYLFSIGLESKKVHIDVAVSERYFTLSSLRYSLFKYAAISCAIKMFGTDSLIDDLETLVFFDFNIEYQKDETIKDVYMQVQKTVSQLYDATIEKLESQLN